MLEAEDSLSGRTNPMPAEQGSDLQDFRVEGALGGLVLPPVDDGVQCPETDIIQLPVPFTPEGQSLDLPNGETAPDQTGVKSEDLFSTYYDKALGIAQFYNGKGVPIEDLQQVAVESLVKAIGRFDPEAFEGGFERFAYKTINGEIKRYFRDHGWDIRPVRRVQEDYLVISGSIGRTTQLLGHQPSVTELAQHLDMDERQVREALAASQGYNVGSIDVRVSDDDETTVADNTSDGILLDKLAMDNVEIERLLALLDPRSRRIVEMYYIEGFNQREIAPEFGVSQFHISRLIKAALEKMRGGVEENVDITAYIG